MLRILNRVVGGYLGRSLIFAFVGCCSFRVEIDISILASLDNSLAFDRCCNGGQAEVDMDWIGVIDFD